MPPDFVLLLDPGSSSSKFIFWRSPSSARSHIVPAACQRVDQQTYERCSQGRHHWGRGAVAVPTVDGTHFYLVGEGDVSMSSKNVGKWREAVAKLLCALGHLASASDEEFSVQVCVQLPLDEYHSRRPMFEALAFALKNGAGVNGRAIDNLKVSGAECAAEGLGLISTSINPSAGLICGHTDLSFVIGSRAEVDLIQSFTASGQGAVNPLRMAELSGVLRTELDGAIAFNRQRWKEFCSGGLLQNHVKNDAEAALEKYAIGLAQDVEKVASACNANDVTELTVTGGSAPLLKPILKSNGLKISNQKSAESELTSILGSDRNDAPRLLDAYQVWKRNPYVAEFLKGAVCA